MKPLFSLQGSLLNNPYLSFVPLAHVILPQNGVNSEFSARNQGQLVGCPDGLREARWVQEGCVPSYKVPSREITPANPMKNHGCK